MRLPIISENTLFRENNELENTPLIYHKTKSSICCWYLIIKCIVVYMFRNNMREIDVGYQKIAFATLNIIRKRVITKMMVDYSKSTL
jgi:hypothetical protein